MSTNQTVLESDRIPLDIVSGSIWIIGSVLGKTWRISFAGTNSIDPFRDQDRGVIYCFWHSHILPMAYIFRNIGVTAVVSASKDGDRATAVAQRWNHDTIRGSSSRGQIGVIRQCNKILSSKRNIVIIPDGPHGPREQVKPGAAMIAMMTNAIVYPVRAISDASWHLNSWDRFMIPKPFTKVIAHIGEPLIPETFGKDVDRFSQAIQQALSA